MYHDPNFSLVNQGWRVLLDQRVREYSLTDIKSKPQIVSFAHSLSIQYSNIVDNCFNIRFFILSNQ